MTIYLTGILEVIESVYPEKTKDAIEATKGDIALGKKAMQRNTIIDIILLSNGVKSLEELNNIPRENKENILQQIEGALKYFDRSIIFYK